VETQTFSDLRVYRNIALQDSGHDTPKKLLITQRSQVQILPPLPKDRGQTPSGLDLFVEVAMAIHHQSITFGASLRSLPVRG